MFEMLIEKFGLSLINGILDKGLEAFKAYETKQISVEQLRDQLYGIMVTSARDIEVAYSADLAKTYASFMTAMTQSKILQRVWAFVVISQATMILWFQFGIPFIVGMGYVTRWPSSGDTAGWSYLLVGACLGMGPMVLKAGPGAGDVVAKLKQLAPTTK